MKKIYLSLVLVFTIACQPNINKTTLFGKDSNTLDINFVNNNLSPEETEALLPNELFKAVDNQNDLNDLKQIIDANGEYLLESNSEGDTPLGFAIKKNNLSQALFLLNQMDPNSYLHQNNLGESYLYLASQKGFVDLIITLSNLFYERQRGSWDYEFSDLDFQTKNGERALHVAKNSAVAEALWGEYYKGFLEFPKRKFQFLANNEGQTFLHTAVRDQNIDLLRWGYQQNCYQSESLWNYAWQGIQNLSSKIYIDIDYLWNTKDNEGLTPLNMAAKNSYFEGIKLLSSCPWTHYLIKDNEGNTPLQNFLLSLDPLVEEHSQETKNIFLKLANRQSLLSVNSLSKNINLKNNKQENSLHIAARLNDSYFYNQLKIHGSTELENQEGQTAKEIFENHQRTIRLH